MGSMMMDSDGQEQLWETRKGKIKMETHHEGKHPLIITVKQIGMGNMMKWIFIGCLIAVALTFALPLLGIEEYGNWGTWLLLLLVLACILPMLLMNREKGNKE